MWASESCCPLSEADVLVGLTGDIAGLLLLSFVVTGFGGAAWLSRSVSVVNVEMCVSLVTAVALASRI